MNTKRNNKGFSLIELIVVIAIMAVLVGILAPAYIRYVEKARQQTCYWNMDGVVGEVQLRAFSDPEFMEDITTYANNHSYDVTEFVKSTDITVPSCPSKGVYTITYNTTTGKLVMECTMTVHNLPSEGGSN